jgi:membrane protein DedA with SNARE-associated domain
MQALIFSWFDQFGYLAIFVGVMLDNAGFPIPGEIVTLLTGNMVAEGHFAYLPAVFFASLGAVLGDSLWYFAGRTGSRRFMAVYCRVSFGSTACIARTERNLSRFGARSLIYARFVPGFRTFAAPMAGMAGVTYRLFLLYDGIGALLWAALWIGLGTYFAQNVATFIDRLENSRLIVLYLAGSLLLLFLLIKWIVRRRHGAATLAIPVAPRIQTPAAVQDHTL